MSDIIKSTSVFHDHEATAVQASAAAKAVSARELFESYENGTAPVPKPRTIHFEVRVLEGDGTDEYIVQAHSYYFGNDCVFFLLDNHVVWFTAVRNLVYVNIPEED